MSLATRELLLKKAPRRYLNLTLPASGLQVRLQSLTEREKSAYETHVFSAKGDLVKARMEAAKRLLIVLCLVDSEGHRLLNDSDVGALEDWDGADASAIYDAAWEFCGFKKNDVENLVKNSEPTHAA